MRAARNALIILVITFAGCSADGSGGYTIEGDAIPISLTGERGDSAAGQTVFSERDQGHCVICHQVSGLEVPFQGNVGPDLSSVGERLSEGQLRLRIVDISKVAPDILMPSYFGTEGLHQVGEAYRGETILTARQVEDLVAYLATLKTDQDS